MSRRFPFQYFDAEQPFVDPTTGRLTPYAMRQLFGQTQNAEEVSEEVETFDARITTNSDDIDTLENRTLTAGTGLSGGGDLTADRTFNLNAAIDLLTDVDTSTTSPTDGQALVWVDADSLWKPGDVASGGGGGGGAWEFVGEEVASGGESTLEVTSIPTDVEALRMLCTGNKTTSGGALIRFNNNSGSNYDFARHFGGTAHNDGLFTNETSFNDLYAVTNASNNFSYLDALILGSGNASAWTTMLAKAGMWNASNYVIDSAGEYQVAEAVTSIQMLANAGTWNAGSKIQIWALKKTASGGGGGGGGGSRSGAGWTKADEPPASPNSNDDEFDDSALDAAWTTINSGAGLTFTETDNGLEGSIGGDGTRLRGLARVVPSGSSDFTITLAIHDLWVTGSTFSGCMLHVTSGTSTAAEGYSLTIFDDANPNFTAARQYWSDLNTRAGNSEMWSGRLRAPPMYLRMRVYDDAGTWKADFSISRSGFFYQELATDVSLGFTPTHMGLGMYDRGSSGANALFGWFRVTEA